MPIGKAKRLRTIVCVLLAGLAGAAGAAAARAGAMPPRTLAESSGFAQTGRYAEVESLCKAYATSWPRTVRCEEFGRSPEGRPLLAMVVSRSGTLDPAEARRRRVPVMLFQGGIHAGEIDGKDAGFMVLRDLLDSPPAPDPLLQEVLVFVPVFNVDGHERFGRWNRPNQVGPSEMGWRTTAQNLNLNRDYMKADAPEMQAMLRLLARWDPILYVDLHVTDGADFQPDVSVQVEPLYTGDTVLRAEGRTLNDAVLAQLAAHGSLPLDFYPEFVQEDDPASGFALVPASPRFSHGYWSQHNRFAALVETHSWKPYERRVTVTRQTLHAMAALTASEGARWLQMAQAADAAAARLGGQEVALAFKAGEHVSMIDFPGYAYTREPSAVSGALWTRFDTHTPQAWHVPLKDRPEPAVVVRAPRAGYVVPAAYADAIGARLALHGIAVQRLDKGIMGASVLAFRATDVHYAKESFEGRMGVALAGAWKAETRDIPAGSLFVPMAQPAARVIVALLDPLGPDSFAAWGFFNTALEPKEYMEPYVAEGVARAQLAQDPQLARDFARKLAEDKDFAASPEARLAFFARRHPSFDERLRLYPVLGMDLAPTGP
jgi:murein tripeptide amidase MpaA